MDGSLGIVLLKLFLGLIILIIILAAIGFLFWIVRDLIKSMKTTIEDDSLKASINEPKLLGESLIGKSGEAITDLTPKGEVHVDGEYWKAVSVDAKKIPKESQISVIEVQGIVLKVKKI